MSAPDVEAEALRRLTLLRLQLLQQQVAQQAQPPPTNAAQEQMHAQHEHLLRQLTAKRMQLQQLDAILEQTLQMQSMFMAHMTAQGLGDRATSVAPANVSPDAQPAVHGVSHDALPQKPVLAGRGGEAAAANHPEAAEPMPSKQAEAIAARAAAAAAAYASQDVGLMNRLHSMSETLQQSEDEAVQAAQEAVDRAAKEGAAAVTTRAREKDGGKAARGRQGEEQGEEEEEEDEGTADEWEEITHDDMRTFRDIGFSYVKKATKHVVANVMMEADINFEIIAPHKGGWFTKSVTQREIDSRLIKLAVRCKGIVKALAAASTKAEVPSALISFLRRLLAHHQKYPQAKGSQDRGNETHRTRATMPAPQRAAAGAENAGDDKAGEEQAEDRAKKNTFYQEDGSYLFPSEVAMLKMEGGGERSAEVTMYMAKYLLAQFLFGRLLVKQVILEPWKEGHKIGPKGVPRKNCVGALHVIAFMLYTAVAANFDKRWGPTSEASIFDLILVPCNSHITRMPGDEDFLLSATKDLQEALKNSVGEILDNLLALCFPTGKPALLVKSQVSAVPGNQRKGLGPPSPADNTARKRDAANVEAKAHKQPPPKLDIGSTRVL